jgi:hypothetical protein
MDPRPGSAVIPAGQEHPFAVKETAEGEVPSVFEEVAPHDAAMSEIRTVVAINIAPNPVVTVELAAINIALTTGRPFSAGPRHRKTGDFGQGHFDR